MYTIHSKKTNQGPLPPGRTCMDFLRIFIKSLCVSFWLFKRERILSNPKKLILLILWRVMYINVCHVTFYFQFYETVLYTQQMLKASISIWLWSAFVMEAHKKHNERHNNYGRNVCPVLCITVSYWPFKRNCTMLRIEMELMHRFNDWRFLLVFSCYISRFEISDRNYG